MSYSNNQLFLNHQYIHNNLESSISEVQDVCARFILEFEWVKNTYTSVQMHENEYDNSFHSLIQKGQYVLLVNDADHEQAGITIDSEAPTPIYSCPIM